MRIQFLKDGRECLLAAGAEPSPDAIAVISLDMKAVRDLARKACHNVNGKAKSGPVHVVLTEPKKTYRITYTPDPGRPEARKRESLDVEAFSDRGAKLKAQGLFQKKFRGDGHNVHRSELTAEEAR